MMLFRKNENALLAGVATGIAQQNKIILWMLRVFFLFPFVGTVSYLLLALFMKDENGNRMSLAEFFGRLTGTYFTRAENAAHFPVSRVVWHFLTGVAVVTFLGATLYLVYCFVPVSARNVDEPKYLDQRDVSATDVLECANSAKPRPQQRIRKARTEESSAEVDDRAAPVVSLAQLQAALPNVQFSQKGRRMICDRSEGHYEYGDWGDWVYPSRCYEYGDVDTKAAVEIRTKLQVWFPYDSSAQQYTVDRLAAHLGFYQLASRLSIYKTSLYWIGRVERMDELWELWDAIDKVIGNAVAPTITVMPEKLFSEMDDFMSKNKYGAPILYKSLELLALADGNNKLSVFKVARQNYREFDLNQELWKDATNKFLAMKQLHNNVQLVKNLQCYYSLYLDEIASRFEENSKLEQEYNEALSEAQAEALAKQKEKEENVKPTSITIGISFGLIFLIIIILALFSIQNLIARMESILGEIKEKKTNV